MTASAPEPGPGAPATPTAAAGWWSSRIHVEQTTAEVIVTGTQFKGDPPEIRDTLKDPRLRYTWDKARQAWVYDKNRGRLQDAADAIRNVLAELDQRASANGGGPASSKPRFPPTPQQQAIIDAVQAGHTVTVHALAGTGKTTTMRLVAEAAPDKKITYLAFNRSIADEAKEVMPRNVTSVTSHGIARRGLSAGPLAAKLRRVNETKVGLGASERRFARWPEDVAPVLGITEPVTIDGPEPATYQPEDLARLAMATVHHYRTSAADHINAENLPFAVQQNQQLARVVLGYAEGIWQDICSPDGRLYFEHDDYRKIWIESRPIINADMIIFDEAQDINPVLTKLVMNQPAQTIVVGDSYQSIYGFTGAVDALATWPADVALPLTQSWRFGPEVADVGNRFLQLLKADLELQGNPALDTQLGQVDNPDAVLTRTNAGAVAAVVEAINADKNVALVGGGKMIEDLANAAKDLQAGKGTDHPELSQFATWNQVVDAAANDPDARSLQMFVRLVDRYTPDGLLRVVKDLVPETSANPAKRPDVVVSTAHKAKGREWDNVRVGTDFFQPTLNEETGELILPVPEELRLSYVTVTRGKVRVELGSLDWIFDPAAAAKASPAATAERAPAIASAAGTRARAAAAPALVAEPAPAPQAPGDSGRTQARAAAEREQPTTAPQVQPAIEAEPAEVPLPPEPRDLDWLEQFADDLRQGISDQPPTTSRQQPAGADREVQAALGRAIAAAHDDVVRVGKAEVPRGEYQEHVVAVLAEHALHALRHGRQPESLTWRGISIGFEYGSAPELQTPLLHDVEGLNAVLVGPEDHELRLPLYVPERIGEVSDLGDWDIHVYATITHAMQQAQQVALSQPEADRISDQLPPADTQAPGAGATSASPAGAGPSSAPGGEPLKAAQPKSAPPPQSGPAPPRPAEPAAAATTDRTEPAAEPTRQEPRTDTQAPSSDRQGQGQAATAGSLSSPQIPAQQDPPPRNDDLQHSFADVLAAAADHAGRDPDTDDPAPAGPYASAAAEQTARAFAQLKQILDSDQPDAVAAILAVGNGTAARADALVAGDGDHTVRPIPPAEPALPPGLEPLHAALRDAHTHAIRYTATPPSWYHTTPQWQQIRAVTAALRDLTDAVTAAPGSYLGHLAGDVRIYGFLRVVTARVSRFIANASRALAAGLDQAGLRDTPGWRALQNLHTRAADFADQLMGALPPGWTLETLDDLKQSWRSLAARLGRGNAKAPGNGVGPVAPDAVSRLRTAISASLPDRELLSGSRAWQRLTGVWDAATPALVHLHQGVLRFENDAQTLGLLTTAWARTCELASVTARRGMDRLEAASPDAPGPRWHTLRLLRHAAEQNIAHLRGDLPPDRDAPLGTYDRQPAGRHSLPQHIGPAGSSPLVTPQASPPAPGEQPPARLASRSEPHLGPQQLGPSITGPATGTVPASTAAPTAAGSPVALPPSSVLAAAEQHDLLWVMTQYLAGRPPIDEGAAYVYDRLTQQELLPRTSDPAVLDRLNALLDDYDAYTGPLTWTEWTSTATVLAAKSTDPGCPAATEPAPIVGQADTAARQAAAAFPRTVGQQIRATQAAAPATTATPTARTLASGAAQASTPHGGQQR